MKIIQFLVAISLLFIGLFLSYEKIELKEDISIIEQATTEESKEEIIIDNIEEKLLEETNNIVKEKSTKNEKQTTQKKTKTTSSSNKTNNKKETTTTKAKDNSKVEELKPKKEEKTKEELKPKCSDFYESITHGKVDKLSKSACVSYGNKIQNNELDEVLDYNEEHGNVKKPTISYFRCYEVVDSNCNTKGWYLHFFCNSGGCDDDKLKSLYG